jgi:SAM-dependent methyltransferase
MTTLAARPREAHSANEVSCSPLAAAPGVRLTPSLCCLCGIEDAEPLAVGEDFEYRTSRDSFLMMRCRGCGLIYLNPRPSEEELPRIYPAHYHAFHFTPQKFGLTYRVRRWLETRRALTWCRGLPAEARILDVGCGDGFHLSLLKQHGRPGWRLEGIEPDFRAAEAARRAGLTVHTGSLESLSLPENAYDLVLLIMTIEHMAQPLEALTTAGRLLRPAGRLVVVTDNAASLDSWLFRGRHWGGYHFPRHWVLLTKRTLRRLAAQAGLLCTGMTTCMTPVNWMYSVHSLLADWGAPRWLVNRFTLKSTCSLAVFTLLDSFLTAVGHGGILRGIFTKPAGDGRLAPHSPRGAHG